MPLNDLPGRQASAPPCSSWSRRGTFEPAEEKVAPLHTDLHSVIPRQKVLGVRPWPAHPRGRCCRMPRREIRLLPAKFPGHRGQAPEIEGEETSIADRGGNQASRCGRPCCLPQSCMQCTTLRLSRRFQQPCPPHPSINQRSSQPRCKTLFSLMDAAQKPTPW